MNDIYELKPVAKVDNSKFINTAIDYKDLKEKFNLKPFDKEIILNGCLEQEKENPNIEIIAKALKLIKKYETTLLVQPYHLTKEQENFSKEKPVKKRKILYSQKMEVKFKDNNASKYNSKKYESSRFYRVVDFLFKP